MPFRRQVVPAALLVLVGFLAVAHLRSRQPLRQAAGLPTWRLQELAVLVKQQEAARALLETQVETLRRQTSDYETALTQGRGLSKEMATELGNFRMVLGLVPVEGPGIRLVVTPAGGAPPGVLPPDVQAQDLSGLANELWAAGAEALAINGLRVLATTGIRDIHSRIVIGTVPVWPPYRIDAIGNPEVLKSALMVRGGFVEGLRSVGLQVTVENPGRLRLAARPSPGTFRHARPGQ